MRTDKMEGYLVPSILLRSTSLHQYWPQSCHVRSCTAHSDGSLSCRFKGALATLLLTLTGCSVGPDYEKPQLNVPAAFSNQLRSNCSVTSEFPTELTTWWETFNDPTLNSLVNEAVVANLDVALATSRVREARALLTISRAGFFPNPNLEGRLSRIRQSNNARNILATNGSGAGNGDGSTPDVNGSGGPNIGAISGQTVNLYDVGFDASWELDLFGGARREVEAAYSQYESRIEARRDALVTLLAEVANNYVSLRGAQRRYLITQQNVAAQQETLELQTMRLNAGLTNELTVSQAQAQLEATSSQLPLLEIPIHQAVHRLSVLLGKDPTALSPELFEPKPLPSGPAAIPIGLPSDLLLRRPDIRQAERELSVATADIGVAVSDLFPKFGLNSAIGLRSQYASSLFESGSKYFSFGPSITWRILNWYAIQANIEVTTARQEQALLNYKKAALHSFEEVENALVSYGRELARKQRLQDSVSANTKAFDLAQSLYKAGIVDFLNVLNAQQGVFQAQDQLVQSEQAVSSKLVALYKALGGGWETTESVTAAHPSDPVD